MQNKTDYKQKYENLRQQFETFAYSVSHDLNAPLRHIGSFVHILTNEMKGNLNDNQKEAVAFILQGVEQSEKIVEALLIYSRLNTVKNPFVSFNSKLLFSDIIIDLSKAIEASGAQISLPDNNVDIEGDSKQIQSMFIALIDNAIKFCSTNKPEIKISINKENDKYIFVIKDNGIGIDKKYFKDIFTIFRKLNHESEGIGIGLTLAQKIAERHDGDIWLESEPGKGSVFYVSLPGKQEE